MTVKARYKGRCAVCAGDISVGDPIVTVFGKGWMHAHHDPTEAAISVTFTRMASGQVPKKKKSTPRSCVICTKRRDVRRVLNCSGQFVWVCSLHEVDVISYISD